jgi:hypothetical protein
MISIDMEGKKLYYVINYTFLSCVAEVKCFSKVTRLFHKFLSGYGKEEVGLPLRLVYHTRRLSQVVLARKPMGTYLTENKMLYTRAPRLATGPV